MEWGKSAGNLQLDPDKTNLTGGSWYSASTFGFTENGTVVTGASDGKIRVSLSPLKPDGKYDPPKRLLIGHAQRVLDHAACGRWLVTTGADQIIRLWYLPDVEQDVMMDLEPALNLFVGSDDEWVIWSKSGYYRASQYGDRYLGYHVNRGPDKEALFFPSDRFQSVFSRPEIIQAIIFYGSEEAVSRNWPEAGVKIDPVDIRNILPPIIELEPDGVNRIESKDKDQDFLEFTLTLESHGKPITRLCVLRNGRLVYSEKPVLPDGTIKISNIPLVPGRNRFKIFAENQDDKSNTIRSNPIEITVPGKIIYEDQPILENGTLYILAIGVSKGKKLHPLPADGKKDITVEYELEYADLDAEAIVDAFKYDQAFEKVEPKLLVNEHATRNEINKALDNIIEKIENRITTKRDVLLVYLAGHGLCRIINQEEYFQEHGKWHYPDQQYYFWNYDLDKNDLDESGLAFMDLGKKISGLPVEVILMTDACHSAIAGSEILKGFDPGKKGIDPSELAKRIHAIDETEMYILNASRRSESAKENSKIRHGFFTQSILDTLFDATKTEMSMDGLINQVQTRVKSYTSGEQNPICRRYGDLLDLVIYKK
jgi:hypothetical protein